MNIQISRNPKLSTLFLCLTLILFADGISAQISGGEMKSEKEKKEKKKKEKGQRNSFEPDSLTGTVFYARGMVQQSYRYFEDQSVYDVHAKLNDEVPMITGGGGFGIIMPLAGAFSLDAGLTYFGHGEAYNYEDPNTDSTFSYTNVYMQAGIPLKLRYTIGEDFQFFGTAGFTPLNILNIRAKSNYTTAEGVQRSNALLSVKEGFTEFNIMGTVGAGATYYFNQIGLSLAFEYRRHLLNTYSEDTFKRIHKMYGIGLNFGIQIRV